MTRTGARAVTGESVSLAVDEVGTPSLWPELGTVSRQAGGERLAEQQSPMLLTFNVPLEPVAMPRPRVAVRGGLIPQVGDSGGVGRMRQSANGRLLTRTVVIESYEPGSLRSDLPLGGDLRQTGPNSVEKHHSGRDQPVTFRAHLAGGRAPGAELAQTASLLPAMASAALCVAEVVLGPSCEGSAAAVADLLTWTRAGAALPTFLRLLGSGGEVPPNLHEFLGSLSHDC
jgi:hypothetical protein